VNDNAEKSKLTMDAGGMSYDQWLELIGRDPVTGWRWVRDGLVTTINVLGRQYLESAEIARFWTRARGGEFAVEAKGACSKGKLAKRPLPSTGR
jgi:hypothetical protein